MVRTLTKTFALLLALAASPSLAQDPGALAARRTRALAAAPLGDSFRSSGIDYRIVRGIRAIERGAGHTVAQRLAMQGAPSDALLEEKGPYLVYQEPAGTAPASAAPGRAVAVDARTGRLGIVTGTVVVRVASQAQAEAVARETGIALEYYAPSIGRAFYQVVAGGDAVAAAARLAARPGVSDVEVDVQVAFRVPM